MIRKLFLSLLIIGASFPVFAINKAGMSGYRYSVSDSGKIATIRPNQSGSTGSLGSVGAVPPGQVGSQIGNTGWYVGASGSGNPSGRGTMVMGHAGDVFFAGTKYPFQAGYEVPKTAIVEALGMLCKNPAICLGIAAASPAISRWLGEGKVGINANPADYPGKPFTLQRDSEWDGYEWATGSEWFSSPTGAAQDWANRTNAVDTTWSYSIVSVDKESYWYTCTNRQQGHACNGGQPIRGGFRVRESTHTGSNTYPASMDDIAPYMDKPDVPAQVVSDLLDKGAEINLPSAPTVTGPAQVQGPKQETSNSDGTKTTSQVTNNYKTEGNTITNTSTVTINQKCIASGSCTDTSVNTTTHPEEPKKPEDPATDTPLPDLPKLYERKYPDGMTGIWNKKKDQFKQTGLVTFVNQMMPTGFVSGSCPSWQIDLSLAQWADMGVYEVAPPCWLWPVAKTILIVSALLLARSLIFGG